MKIRADEISAIIQSQIEEFDSEVEIKEVGTVLSVGDGIARVYGLDKAMAGELVDFPDGTRGMILNLEEDNVGVALFGIFAGITYWFPKIITKCVRVSIDRS